MLLLLVHIIVDNFISPYKYMTIYELIKKVDLLELQIKDFKNKILENQIKDLEARMENIEKNVVYNLAIINNK